MNPEDSYRMHKTPPLVLIPSQINVVHTLSPYLPKIHSNIIFLSTPRSSKWPLPFRFSNQNIVYISHLSHALYMPAHLILLYVFALIIIFGESYKL